MADIKDWVLSPESDHEQRGPTLVARDSIGILAALRVFSRPGFSDMEPEDLIDSFYWEVCALKDAYAKQRERLPIVR